MRAENLSLASRNLKSHAVPPSSIRSYRTRRRWARVICRVLGLLCRDSPDELITKVTISSLVTSRISALQYYSCILVLASYISLDYGFSCNLQN